MAHGFIQELARGGLHGLGDGDVEYTPPGPKSALPGELREPKHHAPQVISAPEAKGLGLHGSTGSPFPLPQMH